MDLYDYADKPAAPKVKCLAWIPHPVRRDERVGTTGEDVNRDVKCGYFLHRREDHERDDGDVRKKTYNTEYDGYAISTWILDLLDARGVDVVFIAVTDQNRLYEFDLMQYQDGVQFEWRDGDPQKVVPLEKAKYDWSGDGIQMTDPDQTPRLSVQEKHLAGDGVAQ